MNDPHFWWYVTRASAVLAWVLMTAAVLWGITLSTRVFRGADNPAWLQDLHRFLGGTALVMTGIHMVSLMLDPWLAMPIDQLLIPLIAEYRPVPVALGILSFYVLLAVQLSSLMKNRLPQRFWKAVHYLSYVAVLAVAIHGAFAGTDAGAAWYQGVATVIVTASVIALIVRLVMARRRTPASSTRPVSGDGAVPSLAEANPSNPLAVTRMRIIAKHPVADGVVRLRLTRVDGKPIEPWYAGAHVTLRLPIGIERQYSLCSDPADRAHVDIAVLRQEPTGQGSAYLHDVASLGDELDVIGPRNHFPLEAAHEYLFIAGGIGITPIRAMIEALPPTRAWRLLYLGRTRSEMAFSRELEERYGDRVRVIAGDERLERLDLAREIAATQADVYACGSGGLLDDVVAATPHARCHVERFIAVDRSTGADRAPLVVVTRKTGRRIEVSADESVLTAMQSAGIPVATSCGTGVCGTCETRVLTGTPLHLDSVMPDDDKDEIGVFYPCVSRAKTPELVLDV
ncbi:2Fe-2S iron-sulfur cluster-binding protein [Microcella sp.]|uniref:2Fe-2S iron-sulfur cluster-binding protein n=1 Tax=Microcella sp. TaxID=1913979 RepID=UPI00299F6CE0|nr:2Fe-2S iron-sulfur cluster-binding protein [Microcella sp.]MDX2026310.1 2Fe-2S iron-sulfur cluster-binding protein [Microcella sp.]